jgi:hypothetical protein
MDRDHPDEALTVGPVQVSLYNQCTKVNNSPADRMIAKHYTGQEEEVLVFAFDGKRKVAHVRLQMEISSSTPAVSAGARYRETLEDVEEDDERRLFALYDRFEKRSYKEPLLTEKR